MVCGAITLVAGGGIAITHSGQEVGLAVASIGLLLASIGAAIRARSRVQVSAMPYKPLRFFLYFSGWLLFSLALWGTIKGILDLYACSPGVGKRHESLGAVIYASPESNALISAMDRPIRSRTNKCLFGVLEINAAVASAFGLVAVLRYLKLARGGNTS